MDRKAEYKSGDGCQFVIIHDRAHLLPYWWTRPFVRPTDYDLFTTRAEAERAVTRFTKFATKGYAARRDCKQAGGKRMPKHIRRRMAEARRYCERLDQGPAR